MAVVWNPWAVPGLLLLVAGTLLAVLVLRAAPGQRANRLLALALFLSAVSVGVGFGVGYSLDTENGFWWAQAINTSLFIPLAPAYFAFVGTLETPLARPTRGRASLVALVVLAVAGEALWIARPSLFIAGVAPAAPLAPYDLQPGPAFDALQAIAAVLLPYMIVATADAWRRAPAGTIARARAKGLAIALMASGVALVAVLVASALGASAHGFVQGLGVPLANLLEVALLAYAILRTQLFDIDLKIKVTVQRGTVVAAFVIVFFIVEKIAEAYLARTFGIIAGSVATGLLLFLAPRLNKMAEQVGNKAAPRVQNTGEYLAFKKLDVYRGAIEEALRHGPLTQKDRAILGRLRDQLEITPDDATALEADVQHRFSTARPAVS